MPEESQQQTIRVELGDTPYVDQFVEVLADFTWAYNSLCWFFDQSADLIQVADNARRYGPIPFEYPPFASLLWLPTWRGQSRIPGILAVEREEISQYVDLRERLIMSKCQVSSPGWIEVIGQLNPLETLRKWVSDRHERRKDREYRQAAERRRLELENDILETELLKKRTDLLTQIGVPKTVIRKALIAPLSSPIRRLNGHLDKGSIRKVRVADSASGDRGTNQ